MSQTLGAYLFVAERPPDGGWPHEFMSTFSLLHALTSLDIWGKKCGHVTCAKNNNHLLNLSTIDPAPNPFDLACEVYHDIRESILESHIKNAKMALGGNLNGEGANSLVW